MTEPLYLSRARLRSQRGEALSAIAPLLIPDDAKKRAGHAHRILWLLFQDVPDSARDFLWRDEGGGKYMILSRRRPSDPLGLFDADTREFEPSLNSGHKLRFTLRAYPTITTKRAGEKKGSKNGKPRGTRIDVVMDALKPIPRTDWINGAGRAFERDKIAADAGAKWLAAQGGKAGFELLTHPSPVIDGYVQVQVERGGCKGRRPAGFATLDFAGEIRITDPAAFLAKLPLGFGSARAFGNGLMLIRRA